MEHNESAEVSGSEYGQFVEKHGLSGSTLKLIAVMISVFLWAGLVSQDESVTRDKVFQNVSVNVTGTETLKSNGLIVDYIGIVKAL